MKNGDFDGVGVRKPYALLVISFALLELRDVEAANVITHHIATVFRGPDNEPRKTRQTHEKYRDGGLGLV
jgi:hypothetical protein